MHSNSHQFHPSPSPSFYNYDDIPIDGGMTLLRDGFAAIAPRVTGSLSTLSSFLIIFIITRSSHTRLSTIYHRIIFMMFCCGILSSVAMALTTLPMPKELEMEQRNGFVDQSSAGTRLGTTSTCIAQGFFFIFGFSCMSLYNCSLCIYYTCAIAFQMREQNIKKYVEPFLHIVSLLLGLVFSIGAAVHSNINVRDDAAWCTMSTKEKGAPVRAYSILIGLILFVIVFCFSLIIWRVVKTQKSLAFMLNNDDESSSRLDANNDQNNHIRNRLRTLNDERIDKIKESQKKTKVVIIQASTYIISFLLSFSWPCIHVIHFSMSGSTSLWLFRIHILLLPLQGFFNAIIFVTHKVYNDYRAYQHLSLWHILCRLLSDHQEPVVVTRIYLVRHHHQEEIINLRLEDEMKIESMSFDLGASGLELQFDSGESNLNDLSGFSHRSIENSTIVYTEEPSSINDHHFIDDNRDGHDSNVLIS